MQAKTIFNGRYKIVIGKKGGVKVYSVIDSNKPERLLRIYGKVSDNDRYVNLVKNRGDHPEGYSIESIKQLINGTVGDIQPLTVEQMRELYFASSLKMYDMTLSNAEIELLPTERDQRGVLTYVQDLDNGTIHYTKYVDFNKSNGFLKHHYVASIHDVRANKTTYKKLDYIQADNNICITDLNSVNAEDLQSIIEVLQCELNKR